MELKLVVTFDKVCAAEAFNRTFMELKLFQRFGSKEFTGAFNRTFMELKLDLQEEFSQRRSLLIAPLWN